MPAKKAPTVQEILQGARLTLKEIEAKAEELGYSLSYDTLQSWYSGRRKDAQPEKLEELAAVLDAQGGELKRLATKARKLANRDSVSGGRRSPAERRPK